MSFELSQEGSHADWNTDIIHHNTYKWNHQKMEYYRYMSQQILIKELS